MKILPKKQLGHPILRSKAKKVTLSFFKTAKGKKLIKEMIYTMKRSNGVGLAAPQIGKQIQLIVMRMAPSKRRPNLKYKAPMAIINPKITSYSKNKEVGWEGCLSIKDMFAQVPRSKNITVSYFNESGEKIIEKATGFWARIFQHEIDHLNGIVYLDRVEDTKTIMSADEFDKMIKRSKSKKRKSKR